MGIAKPHGDSVRWLPRTTSRVCLVASSQLCKSDRSQEGVACHHFCWCEECLPLHAATTHFCDLHAFASQTAAYPYSRRFGSWADHEWHCAPCTCIWQCSFHHCSAHQGCTLWYLVHMSRVRQVLWDDTGLPSWIPYRRFSLQHHDQCPHERASNCFALDPSHSAGQ